MSNHARVGLVILVLLGIAPEAFGGSAFRIKGVVKDTLGVPLVGVDILYGVPRLDKDADMVVVDTFRATSDARGGFDLGPFPDPALPGTEDTVKLRFQHRGYKMVDVMVYEVDAAKRGTLEVAMAATFTWAGVILDKKGKPLKNAVVQWVYDDAALSRGATADEQGRFQCPDLAFGNAKLIVRAYDHDLKHAEAVTVAKDDPDKRIVVSERIRLKQQPETVEAFGVKFVEVTDALRKAYDLPADAKVMVWDAGDPDRAMDLFPMLDGLRKGFWVQRVQRDGEDHSVASVLDLLQHLADDEYAEVRFGGFPKRFERSELTLGPDERDALKALVRKLDAEKKPAK